MPIDAPALLVACFESGVSVATAGERDLLVVSLSGCMARAAIGDLRLLLVVAEQERGAVIQAFESIVLGSITFGIGGCGACGTEVESTYSGAGSMLLRSQYYVVSLSVASATPI